MNEQLTLEPVARATDPDTAHAAARTMQPGNSALIATIRKVLIERGTMTQFQIAECVNDVFPDRWDTATIRTACARAGLRRLNLEALSPRGVRCALYEVPTETIDPGDRL